MTLRAAGRPLRECLRDLSTQFGVRRELDRTDEDRAVTIRVREARLATVMSALESLYGDF